MQQDNQESAIAGREIHEKLDGKENEIRRLKEAGEKFSKRGNLEVPSELRARENAFFQAISTWRNRKTKATSEEEAESAAIQLGEDLVRFYKDFCLESTRLLERAEEKIRNMFREWYIAAGIDTHYAPDETLIKMGAMPDLPKIKDKLLTLKEEQYVAPKEDIFSHMQAKIFD